MAGNGIIAKKKTRCTECQGFGFLERGVINEEGQRCVSYYTCPKCEGAGRVKVKQGRKHVVRKIYRSGS